jgi:hypothetical protein
MVRCTGAEALRNLAAVLRFRPPAATVAAVGDVLNAGRALRELAIDPDRSSGGR